MTNRSEKVAESVHQTLRVLDLLSLPAEADVAVSSTSVKMHISGTDGLQNQPFMTPRSSEMSQDQQEQDHGFCCIYRVSNKPMTEGRTSSVTGTPDPLWDVVVDIDHFDLCDSIEFEIMQVSASDRASDTLVGHARLHSRRLFYDTFPGEIMLQRPEGQAPALLVATVAARCGSASTTTYSPSKKKKGRHKR